MAIDNDNNIPIAIDGGNQAILGTDVYSYSGGTAHAQVMKVAWGDDITVTRATNTTPLPVQVYGLTGTLSTVTVTGAVRGLGSFTVANTVSTPLYIAGGITSYVQGITGAVPVAITGSVDLRSNVGITGYVSITGGRALTAGTDSIRVTGAVSRLWSLNSADDSVKIWSSTGGAYIPISVFAGTTAIGCSGNALNVNVVGAGISANVTIGSTISIQNVAGDVLRVQGTGGGTPIPVTVSSSPTVYLSNSVENSTSNPVFVDSRSTVTDTSLYYGFNRSSTAWNTTNNIERLFLGQKPSGTTADSGIFLSTGQWLSSMWDAIGEKSSTNVNTIQGKLNNVIDGTKSFSTRIGVSSAARVKTYALTPYKSPIVSSSSFSSAAGFMYINSNETNQSILLTSSSFLTQAFTESSKSSFLSCLSATTSTPACETAGIYLTPNVSIEFTKALFDAVITENGGYLLAAGERAFLPVIFDRYFLLSDTSTGKATLTVIQA